MYIFAKRLKFLRTSKKITQRQLAKKIPIHISIYQKYELSKRVPTLEHLIFISEYFDVSLDYLIGKTDTIKS